MQLDGRPELGHLTYCTNIHAGEDWPDVLASLKTHLPPIKAEISPGKPMGVGLRLSASAAEALQDPDALAELRRLLDEGGYYVFTINGFPYGTFHGEKVKEDVYRPDWSEDARLVYTNLLADLLAVILPDGMEGTISTVPGSFKAWARPDVVRAVADNLIRHVAHLVALRARTGRTVILTLEPEPCCLLETIEETIAFFRKYLFSDRALARLAELAGLPHGEAAAAVRTHIGVCYDVCHAAVEYEDPRASIAALSDAGIAIAKIQLSSALRIPNVTPQSLEHLRSFDEPVYLHQVIERRNGQLTRYTDVPDALQNADAAAGAEWRVHFHVPVFIEELEAFGTTQGFLRNILALHREKPISRHLEVETYTWDVLPERYRKIDVSAAIARKLSWVVDQLSQ